MKIGIGLLDLYDDDSLEESLKNIPENAHVCVVSNRKTSVKNKKIQNHIIVDKVSLAHMRNLILHDFRINDLDHYFLIHTDQIIEDSSIFEKVQKLSETFGTWFLLGHVNNDTLNIEDDNGIVLKISKKINTKFIFLTIFIYNHFHIYDQ